MCSCGGACGRWRIPCWFPCMPRMMHSRDMHTERCTCWDAHAETCMPRCACADTCMPRRVCRDGIQSCACWGGYGYGYGFKLGLHRPPTSLPPCWGVCMLGHLRSEIKPLNWLEFLWGGCSSLGELIEGVCCWTTQRRGTCTPTCMCEWDSGVKGPLGFV